MCGTRMLYQSSIQNLVIVKIYFPKKIKRTNSNHIIICLNAIVLLFVSVGRKNA